MSNKRFKKGDKVKCSCFLYSNDYKYKDSVGTFVKYNRYGDDISYICFGQSSETISCFTFGVKPIIENQQLLFEFMNE